MHGVFQRCAVKPYAAERLEVISRTYIFSLYFMIQRLELLFLQSHRVDTALPFSELILVLFQSSIGLLRYYFCFPVRRVYRNNRRSFFVVSVHGKQS